MTAHPWHADPRLAAADVWDAASDPDPAARQRAAIRATYSRPVALRLCDRCADTGEPYPELDPVAYDAEMADAWLAQADRDPLYGAGEE